METSRDIQRLMRVVDFRISALGTTGGAEAKEFTSQKAHPSRNDGPQRDSVMPHIGHFEMAC